MLAKKMMDLKKSKILITGGSGFVGSHLAETLHADGVPLENIQTPRRSECDLLNLEQCVDVTQGIDVVFHIAAHTGGMEEHKQHPGEIIRDNVLMNTNVLEAARLQKVKKVVAMGSATVYAADLEVPYHEDSIWGSRYEKIHLPYSFSKLLLLVMGQTYREQYGMNIVHVIPTNMYGPGDDGKSGYVIPTLINRIKKSKSDGSKSIEVWGSGNSTRDFLYVEDAVRALVAIAEKYDEAEPLNLGSGKESTIRELAEIISKIMGFEGALIWLKDKGGPDNRRLLDISRVREAIGYNPDTDLETGLRKTIHWMNLNQQ